MILATTALEEQNNRFSVTMVTIRHQKLKYHVTCAMLDTSVTTLEELSFLVLLPGVHKVTTVHKEHSSPQTIPVQLVHLTTLTVRDTIHSS